MAWGISGLVWLLLAALTHQSLLVSKAPQNSTECPSFYPSTTGQEVLFFLQILLPFSLISFCNASIIRILQRRICVSHKQPRLCRAKVLVTAVLLLLGLCFLPSVLTRVLMHIF